MRASVVGIRMESDGLAKYCNNVRSMPRLSESQVASLVDAWIDRNDAKAGAALLEAHLYVARAIADRYSAYGLPYSDLIGEANVGLVLALRKFKRDMGSKFRTYAGWWIRSRLSEYVLNNWSMVKFGTTSAQEKLFFGLRKTKHKLGITTNGDLAPEEARRIAETMDVPVAAVIEMNGRLSGPTFSLNTPLAEGDGTGEHLDLVVDERVSCDEALAERSEAEYRSALLRAALAQMDERERCILEARFLSEDPPSRNVLGDMLKVSRERVRQIEESAYPRLIQKVIVLDRETRERAAKRRADFAADAAGPMAMAA